MSAVEKTIVVTPSSKAAVLEVFHQPADDKPKKKVEDGQELPCVVGHLLSGLSTCSNPSQKYHLKNTKKTRINLANTKLLLAFFLWQLCLILWTVSVIWYINHTWHLFCSDY